MTWTTNNKQAYFACIQPTVHAMASAAAPALPTRKLRTKIGTTSTYVQQIQALFQCVCACVCASERRLLLCCTSVVEQQVRQRQRQRQQQRQRQRVSSQVVVVAHLNERVVIAQWLLLLLLLPKLVFLALLLVVVCLFHRFFIVANCAQPAGWTMVPKTPTTTATKIAASNSPSRRRSPAHLRYSIHHSLSPSLNSTSTQLLLIQLLLLLPLLLLLCFSFGFVFALRHCAPKWNDIWSKFDDLALCAAAAEPR